MQMKKGEQYTCSKCGCDVEVTTAPTVAGKGGVGSLTCCGEKMAPKTPATGAGLSTVVT